MFERNLICKAVLYALASGSLWTVQAEQQSDDSVEVETIMVTAAKRSENIQKTAVTVHAMDTTALRDQNVGNFDDFARYMPNVTLAGKGPGLADVYIRGLAIQPIQVRLSGAQGTMPNVALYIDEQPVSAPGRNLDVYATDLQRIEVLPGPQGTLFGAGSQAGTIRYITNKPQLDGVTAGITTSIANTKSGDSSHTIEGYLNLPVTEQMAFRATFYDVRRGGYIDNVYGEYHLDPAINPHSSVNLPEGTTYQSIDNSALVQSDYNEGFYKGFRLGLNYQAQNDWQLLLQHTQQKLGTDGVFDYDPEVGDLAVAHFLPDVLRDDFDQTAWTLEGRLGALEVLYTGAFLDRDIDQQIDFTRYNDGGGFIAYYTCTYNNPDYVQTYDLDPRFITEHRECKDPAKAFLGIQQQRRLTHELRATTNQETKLRGIGGIFYDNFEIKTQDDFLYAAAPDIGFAPNAPISTAVSINPNTRPVGITFFNDITRTEKQLALFGELYYDISEQLTAIVGVRWYDMETDFAGSSNFADGIFRGSMNTDRGRDYDISGGHSTDPLKVDGFVPKLSLSYQLDNDRLFYGTYSEGFRPGGFNRGGGIPSRNPEYPDINVTYDSDDVVNYEVGWKTLLEDRRWRFNGSLYAIQWDNMQVSRFDPLNVSILTFQENAMDAEIIGLELNSQYNATANLTLFAAASYNDTEIVKINARAIEIAPVGSELPLTPKFQANLRASYYWEVGAYQANWLIGYQYAGKSWNSVTVSERERQDSYSMVNFSVAIGKDNWSLKLFADNVTDTQAELFINNQEYVRRVTTNRPRTIGLSFSYDYQ